MKINLYLVLGLVLSYGGVWLWQTPSVFRQPTAAEKQRTKNEGLVRDRYSEDIDRAKAENKTEVILPSAEVIRSTGTSIERIMRDYSLLRVKIIDKETTVSEPDPDIRTWYKLEVVEILHQQDKINDKPIPEEVPSRLLPLLPSESLWVAQGGEITVDGIRVKRVLSSADVDFSLNEEYLIAAYLDYGGKLIIPVAQKDGVFRVEGTNLKPLGHKQHQFVRDVEEMYGNDVNRIRSGIELRRQMREK